MPIQIIQPNEAISRVLEKFRKDFQTNSFKINSHANTRMNGRGITVEEICEAVKHGVLSTAHYIENQIGGKFVFKNLVVVVYAPFGDRAAWPTVVTVYRDGDEDLTYDHQPFVEPAKPSLDDLSEEQLEELLRNKRAQKAEAQRREQQERVEKLKRRKIEIEKQLAHLKREHEEIEKELA